MNLDKINQANEELNTLPTLTDRLNHWKINYFYKYPGDDLHDYFEIHSDDKHTEGFIGAIRVPWGSILENTLRCTNYGVPLEIRIEYYNWMLYFLAERRFFEISRPFFENEIKKPLGIQLIMGEIEKIKRIQIHALEELKNGRINLYSLNDLTAEKLYLWYKNGFYSQSEIQVEDIKNNHVKSVCSHKYVYPYLSEQIKLYNKVKTKKEVLTMVRINIAKLVSELINRHYIDENDKIRLQNWFKGIPIPEPIQINKPMKQFASLIAFLQEAKFIKNSKVFCETLISNSFLFNNETVSVTSIKNIMNKGSNKRISETDLDYIDIQHFVDKN